MCYSKEVSLAVGGAILAVSAFNYLRYVKPVTIEPPPAAPPPSPDGPTPLALRPAFLSMVQAHVCIGLHQLLEFFAIWTGAAWVYRLGLVVSLTSMWFVVRSLEQLTGRNYAAPVVAVVIAATAAHVATRPMDFEESHFWVRGLDHVGWGAVWIALFLYWNAALFGARRSAPTARDARLLRAYGWGVLNLSFVVSFVYAFAAGLRGELGLPDWLGRCLGLPLEEQGYRIVQDTPSLWCVIAGVQPLVLPFVLRALRGGYLDGVPPEARERPGLVRFGLAVVALILTAALYASFPMLKAVAEKMVTH